MAKETSKDVKAAETAETKVEITAEAAQAQTSRKEQKPTQEAVYAASEFVSAAKKIFGKSPECVAAALKAAGKAECTISEAKEIVEKFLKREVQ